MVSSTKMVFVLILLSVVLGASGQLVMKTGMMAIGKIEFLQLISTPTLFQVAFNPLIILGLCFYAVGVVVWLVVLSRSELSYAYPMIAMGYIITSALAWILFKENMTFLRFFGIVSIISGVYLISLKK